MTPPIHSQDHDPTMSLYGSGMVDVIAVSKLAIKVYTAYQNAPGEYKNISEEVMSLRIVVDRAIHYFEGDTLSDNERHEGQKVLQGFQSVLEDLDSLIKKNKSIASAKRKRWQFFKRVKFSNSNITALRRRLTSNGILFNSFIQRFVLAT